MSVRPADEVITLTCGRRVDGRWRIVDDHGPVPFDPTTGKALTSLEPQ